MKKLILIPLLALGIAACGDDPATSPETPLEVAQPVFALSSTGVTITDLGHETKAYDIDNAGRIVGEHWDQAIMWRPPYRYDGYRELWFAEAPASQAAALAINNRGQVVGYKAETDQAEPVGMFWDRKYTELKPVQGYDHSQAWAINDRAQVAGAGFEDGRFTGIIWDDFEPRELDGPGHNCWVYGINNAGQAVGDCGPNTPVFWESGAIYGTELPPVEEEFEEGPFCRAEDINDVGQIVGVCHGGLSDPAPPAIQFAVLWKDGKVIRSWERCWAYAINNGGRIAMTCGGDKAGQAFLWDGADNIPLGSLEDPYLDHCWAYGINDRNQVVGLCRKGFPDEGNHAVVWEP